MSSHQQRDLKVSVVLPVYNRENCVAAAIESVLSQSHSNLELIVVDDGSTDRTVNVVSAINDPRLRIEKLVQNRGANSARNFGILAASGDYLAFQDSDDLWHPEKLAVQLEALRESDARIGFCKLHYSGRSKNAFIPKASYRIPPGKSDLSHKLLMGSFISTQTILVHRECFENCLFDTALGRLQDWELLLRLSQSYPICYVDQVLVQAADSGTRISTGHDSFIKAAEYILSKHRHLFERARESFGIIRINAALLAMRAGDWRSALPQLRGAYRDSGRSLLISLVVLLLRGLAALRSDQDAKS